MEQKTISKETREKIDTLPRLDYTAFQLLVTQGSIKRLIKFTKPRTIFFDESDGFFYYLNPYHLHLQKCGYFLRKEDGDG